MRPKACRPPEQETRRQEGAKAAKAHVGDKREPQATPVNQGQNRPKCAKCHPNEDKTKSHINTPPNPGAKPKPGP